MKEIDKPQYEKRIKTELYHDHFEIKTLMQATRHGMLTAITLTAKAKRRANRFLKLMNILTFVTSLTSAQDY